MTMQLLSGIGCFYLTAVPSPLMERKQNKSPLPDYKIKKHNRKKGK